MDIQNTVSRNNQHNMVPEKQGGGVTSYLINTSKAVKGVKLKTKDFIRVQLLKFRRCSPGKYNQFQEQKVKLPCKSSIEYRKFKPFETIEDEQIYKIISNQRKLISRETKGREKLFNNTKINTMFFDQSMNITHESLAVRPKAATSHQSRISAKRNYVNYNTVSQGTAILPANKKKVEKGHTIFHSDNLGTKMNDYLNLYLSHQEDKRVTDEKQREQNERSRVSQQSNVCFMNSTLHAKKKTNHPFMRQMKKHNRGKGEETYNQLHPQSRSYELSKHISADISQRQQAKTQNTKLFNQNCIQLNRKYNLIQLNQQIKGGKEAQSDRVFERIKR